jgi:hypothetical protein
MNTFCGIQVPNDCRIGINAIVNKDALLSGNIDLIGMTLEKMTRRFEVYLADKCIRREEISLPGLNLLPQIHLQLDAFVLPPEELARMLAEARAQGEQDALRYLRPF